MRIGWEDLRLPYAVFLVNNARLKVSMNNLLEKFVATLRTHLEYSSSTESLVFFQVNILKNVLAHCAQDYI